MPNLTEAQKMMVEDGLPAELIIPTEQRRAAWKGRRLKPTREFADPKPTKEEDPATIALRKEVAKAEERKKAERIARLKELKPAAKPARQETEMTKTSERKTARKLQAANTRSIRNNAKAARKSATCTPTAAKGVRPGSKLETIVGLLKRPQGCTTADVLKATDWPAVSMPQQARAAGLTLRKEKKDGVTVYYAA